jgi:hypothetical protein
MTAVINVVHRFDQVAPFCLRSTIPVYVKFHGSYGATDSSAILIRVLCMLMLSSLCRALVTQPDREIQLHLVNMLLAVAPSHSDGASDARTSGHSISAEGSRQHRPANPGTPSPSEDEPVITSACTFDSGGQRSLLIQTCCGLDEVRFKLWFADCRLSSISVLWSVAHIQNTTVANLHLRCRS